MITPSHERHIPASTIASEVIATIDRRAELLLGFFDSSRGTGVMPSDSLGRTKHIHMQQLAASTDAFAAANGLSSIETELLRIVLRGHDLGRHLEAFLPDKKAAKPGEWHAQKSIEILNGKITNIEELEKLHTAGRESLRDLSGNLLAPLSPAARAVVEFAIRYHSTRTVPSTDDSTTSVVAEKLCYILRDNDKLDILVRGKFAAGNPAFDYLDTTGRGIWNQIQKFASQHFAGLSAPLPTYGKIAEQILKESLAEQCHTSVQEGEQQKFGQLLLRYFNGPIRVEDIETFKRGQSLTLEARGHSYAGFMLLHCAMVFDVRSRAALLQVVDQRLLTDRLKFIAARVPPRTHQDVVATLNGYLSDRLRMPVSVS